MRRRVMLRVVVVGGLFAAIVAATVLVASHESPTNRRMRQIARIAGHVPECSETQIDTVPKGPRDPTVPGRRLARMISCGPPDNLGPYVGVDVFTSHAGVLAAMAVARRDTYGSAQCATRTERFDLGFFDAHGDDRNAVKIARGYDRGFCRAVGAAPPQFTGAYLRDGET